MFSKGFCRVSKQYIIFMNNTRARADLLHRSRASGRAAPDRETLNQRAARSHNRCLLAGASKGIMAPFRPPLKGKQNGKKAPQMHDEEGDATAYGPRTIQMLAGAALAAFPMVHIYQCYTELAGAGAGGC